MLRSHTTCDATGAKYDSLENVFGNLDMSKTKLHALYWKTLKGIITLLSTYSALPVYPRGTILTMGIIVDDSDT